MREEVVGIASRCLNRGTAIVHLTELQRDRLQVRSDAEECRHEPGYSKGSVSRQRFQGRHEDLRRARLPDFTAEIYKVDPLRRRDPGLPHHDAGSCAGEPEFKGEALQGHFLKVREEDMTLFRIGPDDILKL